MSKKLMLLCAVLLALPLYADTTLPDLFRKAKDEFSAGDYKQSLADFDLLDNASRKAGYENDRAKLAPVILFYRGANLAALGKKDDATEVFVSYLLYVPNAVIASPPFSKEIVAFPRLSLSAFASVSIGPLTPKSVRARKSTLGPSESDGVSLSSSSELVSPLIELASM